MTPAPTVHGTGRAAGADLRVRIPGGTLACTVTGTGPPLVLLHGLGGSRHTWRHLVGPLSVDRTVLAPDLPGHGDSDPPAGDYSIGAHATAVRDLLMALDHPSASVVGHSLGGGVGLAFAYQFPERISRLALIGSGGLGPGVTPMLRAATLPGAGAVLGALSRLPRPVTRTALPMIARFPGLMAGEDAVPLADSLAGLAGARRRESFLRTAAAVLDWRGQTVDARDRLDVLADLPLLLLWGANDRTIPARQQRALARRLARARAHELSDAGHYPQETDPDRVLPLLQDFLTGTTPFRHTETRWREATVG